MDSDFSRSFLPRALLLPFLPPYFESTPFRESDMSHLGGYRPAHTLLYYLLDQINVSWRQGAVGVSRGKLDQTSVSDG